MPGHREAFRSSQMATFPIDALLASSLAVDRFGQLVLCSTWSLLYKEPYHIQLRKSHITSLLSAKHIGSGGWMRQGKRQNSN